MDLQYVDARDLARWTLDAVEAGLSGPYNVVSESGHTTMGELLDTCVQVTGNVAQLHWVTPEAVLAAGVEPWTELPIWLPPGELHDLLHRGRCVQGARGGTAVPSSGGDDRGYLGLVVQPGPCAAAAIGPAGPGPVRRSRGKLLGF